MVIFLLIRCELNLGLNSIDMIILINKLIKHVNDFNLFDNLILRLYYSFAESFISIKFEENGAASWEKGNKVSVEQSSKSWNHDLNRENKDAKQGKDTKETMSVIEHSKPRGSLRWRKRIGHLFQVIRWKRSNRGNNVCHVGTKVEGVKVRKGWIRTLTKRRTKE